jgi:hypothetical protein
MQKLEKHLAEMKRLAAEAVVAKAAGNMALASDLVDQARSNENEIYRLVAIASDGIDSGL